MSRNRKQPGGSSKQPKPSGGQPGKPTPGGVKLTGWRLWQFRLAAAIGVPFFLLVFLELGLRVAGYGYSPHFFRPLSKDGRELVVQNNQFGWRFFGPAMARQPDAFSFPRVKPPGTIRIFVFGESAAFGDPQSQFGLPRMLQAMLELRHPGVKFEVINAAMTGIDSNVILPIARDCAQADGDVWVVYMGNNEVVGPYGAGTVFGPQAPPVWEIRASLALKATRIGQLFDALGRRLHPPPSSKSEWGGMQMFLDQQVRADDPRMNGVYRNFQQNLADIIRMGTSHGAGVVVSTVPVNVQDSAPFASEHRPGLSEADLEKWNALYQQGVELQKSNSWRPAADRYAAAARIDNSFAELRFRQGMCDVALTNIAGARNDLVAARDLDTLRFRCDSQLNELIRGAVPANGNGRVLLADADHEFAARSPSGLPGDDLFYEHVHLTFLGNYLLAGIIGPQVEKLLPAKLVPPAPAGLAWPSGQECGERLAWDDWELQNALTEILERLNDPPFTAQFSHDFEVEHLTGELKKLVPLVLLKDGLTNSIQVCQTAIAAWPDDGRLYEQLAALKQAAGDLPAAADAGRRAVQLVPTSGDDWSQLGLTLGELRDYTGAADAFRQAVALDQEDVWSMCNLGHAYENLNRRDDAINQYRRAVETKPRFGPGWLALGQALAAAGSKAEAENCYRLAITNRIHHPQELLTLARFCETNGMPEDAVAIYDEAAQTSPSDKVIPYAAGLVLAAESASAQKAGKSREETALRAAAVSHFRQAVRLDPDFMQAHFEWGRMTDDVLESVREFHEAVRLDPSQAASHLNLALAFERAGDDNDALDEFAETLKRDPKNETAWQHGQALRTKQGTQKKP